MLPLERCENLRRRARHLGACYRVAGEVYATSTEREVRFVEHHAALIPHDARDESLLARFWRHERPIFGEVVGESIHVSSGALYVPPPYRGRWGICLMVLVYAVHLAIHGHHEIAKRIVLHWMHEDRLHAARHLEKHALALDGLERIEKVSVVEA